MNDALSYHLPLLYSCGGERNIALYQQLLNKTQTDFLIQDCHDSRAASDPHVPRAPPNETWCPFNTWRNSYDEVRQSSATKHSTIVNSSCRALMLRISICSRFLTQLIAVVNYYDHRYRCTTPGLYTLRYRALSAQHERTQHRGYLAARLLGNGRHVDGRGG